MGNGSDSKLLCIFVGEADQVHHKLLYERIVYKTKNRAGFPELFEAEQIIHNTFGSVLPNLKTILT